MVDPMAAAASVVMPNSLIHKSLILTYWVPNHHLIRHASLT